MYCPHHWNKELPFIAPGVGRIAKWSFAKELTKEQNYLAGASAMLILGPLE